LIFLQEYARIFLYISVKCFEQSWCLDTALYKNLPFIDVMKCDFLQKYDIFANSGEYSQNSPKIPKCSEQNVMSAYMGLVCFVTMQYFGTFIVQAYV